LKKISLKSKFISFSDGLRNKNKIIICGWVASGSTYIYNILREVGVTVEKTHGFPDENRGEFSIYTIRDPRDVAVSTAKRYYNDIFENESEPLAIVKAIDHLTDECGYLQDFRRIKEKSHNIIIRYENFFVGNEETLVRLLFDQIPFNVGDDEVGRLIEEYSLEKNKKKMKKMETFHQWDPETQIHGNHISNNGEQAVYKKYFTQELFSYFEEKLGSLRQESGYPSE